MKSGFKILLIICVAVALVLGLLSLRRSAEKDAVSTVPEAAVASPVPQHEAVEELAAPIEETVAEHGDSPPTSDRETAKEGYRVVKEGKKGVTLTVELPDYRVDTFKAEGRDYQRVDIPGYLSWADPGRPSNPAKIIKVPLPGVESIRLKVDLPKPVSLGELDLYTPPPEGWSPEEVEAILEDPIVGNPELLAKLPPEEQEFLKIKKAIRDSNVSDSQDTPLLPAVDEAESPPGEVVEAGEPYWQRDEQFVNLLVRPARYLPSGETLVYPEITVELEYGPPAKALIRGAAADYGEQFMLASAGTFKASVALDGLQAITYQDLVDVGFPLAGNPRNFKMFFLGNEISIYVNGEDDGSWDPGDYVHFYGQGNTGFYSQTNVYWLYQDTVPGMRMDEVTAPPGGRPARQEYFLDSRHLEKNYVYFEFKPPDAGEDYWFWTWAGYSYATTWTMETSIILSDVSQAEGTVPFTGCFVGNSTIAGIDPDHHTQVRLNGNLIGDFYWDGRVEYILQADIPQNYFVEGSNTITVDEVRDTGASMDIIYINYFDIGYDRGYADGSGELPFSASGKGDYTASGFNAGDLVLYEITDPNHPSRVTGSVEPDGSGYLLRFRKNEAGDMDYVARVQSTVVSPPLAEDQPSDLTTPRLLDYILITHPDFSGAIDPLVAFRQGDGLLVESFLIQDVYDTFSYGNFDPTAIKNFLAYTYYYWTRPPPSYVLLAGGGVCDYQNYRGLGIPNYVPPYMIPTELMQAASDNWFACIVGDDKVPDMSIGRLTVNSFSEATEAVGKIIAYENQTSGLPWQEKVVMVADTPDPSAGDFPADSDWLAANYVPAPYVVDKVYRPDYPSTQATRNAIRDRINNGCLIINYLGHGSTDSWGGPTFFTDTDLNYLNNPDYLPLMTTMTCLNGNWSSYLERCLADLYVNATDKGTIANFSSSGFCYNSISLNLAAYLFDEMLVDGRKKVGPAITEAKSRLGGFEELDLYHLFGDPALNLK